MVNIENKPLISILKRNNPNKTKQNKKKLKFNNSVKTYNGKH